jgi:TusA-related sulfurtransferase
MNTNKTNKQELMLLKIHKLFKKQKYNKVLTKLSNLNAMLANKTINTNNHNQILCISLLCDIALLSSHEEIKAQALFDKAQALKQLNTPNIWKIILDDIKSIDDINEYLNELSNEMNLSKIKKENLISYDDFMQSVANKKSFKTAFINSMFSSKIAITSTEEFGTLAYNLIKNNFDDIANNFIGNNSLYENANTKTMIFKNNKKAKN